MPAIRKTKTQLKMQPGEKQIKRYYDLFFSFVHWHFAHCIVVVAKIMLMHTLVNSVSREVKIGGAFSDDDASYLVGQLLEHEDI